MGAFFIKVVEDETTKSVSSPVVVRNTCCFMEVISCSRLDDWSGSSASFRYQIPELSTKYTVISYDLRGHGKSDIASDGYTIERYAQDLNNLLDHFNLERVSLIGWSLGAFVSFEYVKQYGCTRLNKFVIVDMTSKLITEEGYSHGLYGNYTEKDALLFLAKMNDSWKSFADFFVPTLYASNVDIAPRYLKQA